ncbi:hypothetical protein IL306_004842 [Fusarium sp. DS 682]|nr:hypothetical protein IL306_004842 [Fusarium sp. DS 682]
MASSKAEDEPISLSQAAPAGPIPTTIWHAYFSYGLGQFEYKGLLEQRSPCIRSLRQHSSSKVSALAEIGPSYEYENTQSAVFPYPEAYRKLVYEVAITMRPDEEQGAPDAGTSPEQQISGRVEAWRIERNTGISNRVFGVTRSSVIEFELRMQPTYVVLGIFPRGALNPQERIVFVDKPEQLFSKLRWAALRLHNNGIGDLHLLMNTYKSWYVPRHISVAWADWIHRTLNNESLHVQGGEYAIELVLDWSVTRISIVVLVPVLLSLAIGIWLNSKAWTDLATIQTAWGTASYIVTAGACKFLAADKPPSY